MKYRLHVPAKIKTIYVSNPNRFYNKNYTIPADATHIIYEKNEIVSLHNTYFVKCIFWRTWKRDNQLNTCFELGGSWIIIN